MAPSPNAVPAGYPAPGNVATESLSGLVSTTRDEGGLTEMTPLEVVTAEMIRPGVVGWMIPELVAVPLPGDALTPVASTP